MRTFLAICCEVFLDMYILVEANSRTGKKNLPILDQTVGEKENEFVHGCRGLS